MPIDFKCTVCGKRFRTADRFAGRTIPCPNCQQPLTIPAVEDESGGAYGVLEAEERPPLPPLLPGALGKPVMVRREPPPPPLPRARRLPHSDEEAPVIASTPAQALPRAKRLPDIDEEALESPSPPVFVSQTPLWLRHLHWLLALAMIPLVVSLLYKDAGRDDFKERLERTISQAPPERQEQIRQTFAEVEKGNVSEEELFHLLPRQRLVGAFLPRRTIVHWLMALIAIILFMMFFMLLAVDRSAKPWHLLCVGLFTATIGVFALLHREQRFYEYVVPLIVFIAGPMLLHGLYDTFLKKEMNVGALVIAAMSFAFLAALIYWLRGRDDERAARKFYRELGEQ